MRDNGSRKKATAKAARPKRRQTVIIVVPTGKVFKTRLDKLARNPVLLDEDEGDYQYSKAVLEQGGKPIALEKVLKQYGRR